ncbi:MAG: hypothetical protein M3Y08_05285 [Fibrobacterota bacterium]|nr:hypothetical protein [Fibrobacterota bacterium]
MKHLHRIAHFQRRPGLAYEGIGGNDDVIEDGGEVAADADSDRTLVRG